MSQINSTALVLLMPARTYPDTGVEGFGYTARGLVAYTNQLNKITFYGYDEALRKTFETNANTEIIRYTNNPASDLLSLTDGKNQTTKWKYDLYGRVTNKLDQAGTVVFKYGYDANNRLIDRWGTAGNTTTTYKYDPVGNLTNVVYKAGPFAITAPAVTMQYDALNRVTNRIDGIGSTKYSYYAGGLLKTEDGPWASDTVTNSYVNRLRTNLKLEQPTGSWTNRFTYDQVGRLATVTSPAGPFAYLIGATAPASPLIGNLSLPNGSYITNTYDSVARLTGTHLKNSSHSTLNSHAYTYNVGNQRTLQTFADASTHGYTYDNIGQLKKADSSVNSEDKGYAYDAAWNLNYRTNNGGTDTFSVDGKNQLTEVNSYDDTYDAYGNLTLHDYNFGDDSHIFSYDGDNRLKQVDYYYLASLTDRITFQYDGLGRLRVRQVSDCCGVIGETRYIYDGWRVIQERDSNSVPVVSYTRGTDLSGSLEGAGGIGGLLARSHDYSAGNWSTHNYYHADGNGNITYMVSNSQTLAASYRYDPYGNLLSSSGSLASANKYRFSSKEWIVIDETYAQAITGIYYYGYRFYAPILQRWLNHDPIEEEGGLNLYSYVKNNPVNWIDLFGLRPLTDCEKKALVPYIPQEDLDNADLHDGKVPWYLSKEYAGITRGNDIYFRPGVYDPSTPEGLAVLGHELVHVGQYRNGMNWAKYFWASRHGYEKNPYEKPAYDKEAEIMRNLTKAKDKCCPK